MWICNTACFPSLASERGWGCRERSWRAAPRCPIGMTTAFAEEPGSKTPWAFESLMDTEQTWADLSPWHSLALPVFSFFSLLFFILRKILEPAPMKTSRILDAFLSWESRHVLPFRVGVPLAAPILCRWKWFSVLLFRKSEVHEFTPWEA